MRNSALLFLMISGYATGFTSCQQKAEQTLFTDVTASSGISFINQFEETDTFNVFNFMNMYNGGGVAVADLNNDGLQDIYFTANQLPNKLYLNKGNLQFEDITEKAGVAGKKGWSTGVSIADVNGDGLLDIYLCYSGLGDAGYRANQLFLNKGNQEGIPVFKESAAALGIDAPGTNSNQSVFFDYDRDGDLDMFLLNHATTFYSPFFNTTKLRTLRHPSFSHRFYRNDAGHFTDISEKVGIKGGGNTFGLGVIASDINNDGWPDLFMTNDFEEQDYLLLNNQDGTFRDITRQAFGHISRYGMGCDIADYNNDGLMDLFVADMMPEDNKRQKLLKGPDQYDKYTLLVDSGYFHQNMRNTLQLNQGLLPDGSPKFSEIGQLAGVSNTDWSWSTLFGDYNNDGHKDLFITNGYWKDFTNLDFSNYVVNDYQKKYGNQKVGMEVMQHLSQTKLTNYLFRNTGNLRFQNVSQEYGLTAETSSNGAAYADLDNDGDLDLIINNIGENALIYRNNSELINKNNYVKIQLQDTGFNKFAIGAKVTIETSSGNKQVAELFPVRGFLSCMPPTLHFGLGKDSVIKKITVDWPTGKRSSHDQIQSNTLTALNTINAITNYTEQTPNSLPIFSDVTDQSGVDYFQKENKFIDFKHELLLPWQLSKQGPRIAKADVDKDGLEDFFIGGAIGQSGKLYLQQKDGTFKASSTKPWATDSLCEDIQSAFFDVDNDGDPDLLVVSGGNEPQYSKDQFIDRLYLNDGKGHFSKTSDALPALSTSKSCVAIADFDKDGRPDLFIGGRSIPGKYGAVPESYLLRNSSSGTKIKFEDVTQTHASELRSAGMVTDATWTDLNGDGWMDLIVVGEWMPVKFFLNKNGKLVDESESFGITKSGGLWTRIIPADLDQDGNMDFVLGNLAPNTQLYASEKEPMTLHVNDFLKDGTTVSILCYYIQGVSYPYPSRDELTEPLPFLKKKFLKYAPYATATIKDIFTPEQLKGTREYSVHQLKNCWMRNEGNGKFSLVELPVTAQFSALQAAIWEDFDKDGKPELFVTGNFFPFRVQLGRQDAGSGVLVQMGATGKWITRGFSETGVIIDGDIRDMISIHTQTGNPIIVVGKNSDRIQILKTNREP